MRLPMAAPLFKRSNTKQESVPTHVGTNSLVLLERSNGPQNRIISTVFAWFAIWFTEIVRPNGPTRGLGGQGP